MNNILSTDQTPEHIASVMEALTETPNRLERLSKSVPAPSGKFRQPLGADELAILNAHATGINSFVDGSGNPALGGALFSQAESNIAGENG